MHFDTVVYATVADSYYEHTFKHLSFVGYQWMFRLQSKVQRVRQTFQGPAFREHWELMFKFRLLSAYHNCDEQCIFFYLISLRVHQYS